MMEQEGLGEEEEEGSNKSPIYSLIQYASQRSFIDEENARALPVFDEGMRRLGSEIAFLIKTFFFAYLGLIVSIQSFILIIYGITISLLLLIVRYVAVSIISFKSNLNQYRGVITFAFTRGLAAAVLDIIVLESEIPYANMYIDIAFIVILMTSILSAIGIFSTSRRTGDKIGVYIPGPG